MAWYFCIQSAAVFLSYSGDGAGGASGRAGMKQEPLKDDDLIVVDCCLALCIDVLNQWDSLSPLISVSVTFDFLCFESHWN
jgi:hypothetical protein